MYIVLSLPSEHVENQITVGSNGEIKDDILRRLIFNLLVRLPSIEYQITSLAYSIINAFETNS